MHLLLRARRYKLMCLGARSIVRGPEQCPLCVERVWGEMGRLGSWGSTPLAPQLRPQIKQLTEEIDSGCSSQVRNQRRDFGFHHLRGQKYRCVPTAQETHLLTSHRPALVKVKFM